MKRHCFTGQLTLYKTPKTKTLLPLLLLISLTLLLFTPAHSQNTQTKKTIRGQVLDSLNNKPIEGVSVTVEGSNKGVATDKQGRFTIESQSDSNNIVFSYVGYEDVRMRAGQNGNVTVRLQTSSSNLNQVVVIGYGTQKRATLTGAVAVVTGGQLVKTKNENLVNSLAGKVPGLRVVQKSGEPGAFNTSFDIRGFGNPLVIIDGIPRDNITRLDPYEIEDISVVKDATAAVYGFRGANGVILITTKNGKRGKSQITYSGSYGAQKYLGFPDLVNAVDFMKLTNEHVGHNVDAPGVVRYSDAEIAAYENGTKTSTDWFNPVIKKYTPQYQNNISAAGGNDRMNYFISIGNLYQNGIWKTNDLNYKKYNFRSNVSAKISNSLTAEMRLSGISDTRNAPYTDSWAIIRGMWRELPLDPLYANNNPAYPYKSTDVANPLVTTNSDLSGYKINKGTWLQGSVSLAWDMPFLTGLQLKGLFSYDYNGNEYKEYRKTYYVYTYDAATNTYPATAANSPTSLQRNFGKNTQSLTQLQLSYNHTFRAEHNVSLLALYEESDRYSDNFNSSRQGGLLDALDELFAGGGVNQVGYMDVNGLTHYANKALVGRADYNYLQKYLLGFSFRYDGSSLFAPGHQWDFFPVLSGGWRMSEEDFFKNTRALSFINNLKLRATYGKTGQTDFAAYQFVSGYNYPSGGAGFNGNWVSGLAPKGANPNLTWGTAKTLNIGADVDMWKGLLGLQFDAFSRKREGLPATRTLTLPGTVGTNLPQENLNSDQTAGFEFVVNHRNRLGQVNYNVSANIAYTRTKWKYVERAQAGNSYDNWLNNLNGRYNDIQWGLGYTGQVQDYGQIYGSNINYGGGNRGLLPGDFLYEDWNHDGIIDGNDNHPLAGSRLPNINDVTTNVTPQITYGGSINVEYKGVDFNVLIQGAGRYNVQYIEALKEPGALGGNILSQFNDRWHPVDPKADPYDPHTQWVSGYYAYTGTVAADNTERSIQNAAYVRIKSLELGYTLPVRWTKKVGISNCRFYVNGYNVATFTKLKFLDPEHPADLYGYMYPLTKTYNAGLNLTF